MGTKDPRIDAYIAKSADFAQPILTHLRSIVHDACPDVEETLKWNHPNFTYNGMLCSMAAFKAHCVFGFWKGSLIFGEDSEKAGEAAGHFGRITSVGDLPSKKVIAGYVKEAMRLNDAGEKVKAPPKRRNAPVRVPADLSAALAKNKKASAAFAAFSPSKQRDYVEWLAEAKTDATREKRLATAVEWIAEGKARNWKYER